MDGETHQLGSLLAFVWFAPLVGTVGGAHGEDPHGGCGHQHNDQDVTDQQALHGMAQFAQLERFILPLDQGNPIARRNDIPAVCIVRCNAG